MFSFYFEKIIICFLFLFFFGCGSKKILINQSDVLIIETVEIKKNDDLVIDSDSDGVVDKFDLEKNTPIGNLVDDTGRSLDLDQDAIPDYIDDDPFSTLGAFVDGNGRELDDDGDGVANNLDLEPNTQSGTCVNKKGQLTTCEHAIFPFIFFYPNSNKVEDFNLDRLKVIASVMRKNINYKLKVVGFFDSNGLESYNINLDVKRAESVINILSNIFGIDINRMEVSSGVLSNDMNNNISRVVKFQLF